MSQIQFPLSVFGVCCALVFSIIVLSGCNTVEGFGRDLQSAGESIESVGKKSDSDD